MHQRLELAGNSYALLNESSSARVAVIFVHGFLGCPEKTWIQFQTLIDSAANMMPWWNSYDAYFYAYKSLQQIGASSASLLDFIADIYPSPAWRKLGVPAAIANRKYTSLVLVGHSEGGVLIRKAILRRAQDHIGRAPEKVKARLEHDRILDAHLKLFAPAFWGSLLSGYTGLMLRVPILGELVHDLVRSSAAYKQLQQTSPLLQDMRNRTVSLAERYPSVRAFRANNLFGDNDEIVNADSLVTDPPAQYEKDQSHRSICKPRRNYLVPLTFVRCE